MDTYVENQGRRSSHDCSRRRCIRWQQMWLLCTVIPP